MWEALGGISDFGCMDPAPDILVLWAGSGQANTNWTLAAGRAEQKWCFLFTDNWKASIYPVIPWRLFHSQQSQLATWELVTHTNCTQTHYSRISELDSAFYISLSPHSSLGSRSSPWRTVWSTGQQHSDLLKLIQIVKSQATRALLDLNWHANKNWGHLHEP